MRYEKLFSPLTVRGCTFPNRIMRTSMVSRLAAEDGTVTDVIKDRYRREAMGGPGAIVVEAAVVLPSRSSYNLRISDDSFVPHLKEIADAIRETNSEVKVGIQVLSFLKLSRSGWRQLVEDLTSEDLSNAVNWHVDAARRAVDAGFDFIELHNAHGFTLASFLSIVNNRTDEYGGRILEDRLRLPTEIYQAVRDKVGENFPVGVRINGEDFTRPGTTVKQSKRIARRFAELGADYISISAGDRFEDSPPVPGMPPFPSWGYSGARMSPKWWAPDGTNVYLAEEIRGFIRKGGLDVPVAIAGKIRTPELAEEILQQGRADIIGLCRALLCDPDLPVKAKEGRAEDIVNCCACGWCNDADGRYETVKCILWQKENEHAPAPFLLVAPCKEGCPAGIDVEGYIQLIVDGEYKES
ncbi:NADH:flavin oxidoreductase, partial [Chloroflexota bacterium]